MGILDHLRVNRIFVSKHVPKVAMTAERVNRLAQIIGEVPGGDFTGAKCIGMGFVEVSNFYAKQAQKGLAKNFKKVLSGVSKRVDDLKDIVSKKDQMFVNSLEKVDITYKDLKDQEVGGMQELKNDIRNVQAQITTVESMIIDLRHLSGCQVIIGQYISFNSKVSKEEWSFKFQYFIAEFEGSLRDFSRSNLNQLFLKIFKNHCSKSWEPLYRAFIYIWDNRAMYFFIKCTYILHLPKSAPLIDIEQFLKHELEMLENDFKTAEDTIQTVTFGFFRSILTSNSSRRHQWEAYLEDLEWRQTTEYKFLQDISFWNQGVTKHFTNFVANEEQYMKFCVSIEHHQNLTKQESIQEISNQFLLNQLEDSMKGFNEENLCMSFAKFFKEKCQNNWDPLYEEYCKIKRCRLMYLDVKLNYMAHIHSSSIDLKKKGDEEKKILEKDIKTVDNAMIKFLDASLVDLNEEVLCESFLTIYKEKCQNSLDPVLEEYTRLKSSRSMYSDLKLTFIEQIIAPDKDTKIKVDKEIEIMEKDMKTLKNAIQIFLKKSLKDEGLSKFNGDFFYKRFMNIFKEKCQDSWDPLIDEYHRIKSMRSMFSNFKLAIIELSFSSDKVIKMKIDEEMTLINEDMNTVNIAIQNCIEDGMENEGLKDLNEDLLYNSFQKIFKEKCQNSWSPLFEEYHQIKSRRSKFMNLKLAFNKYIYSSDKDIEEKHDQERKLLEKDKKTVDNAIQRVCSGFFFAALHARADWPLDLEYIPDFNEIEKTESNFYTTSTVGEIMYGDKSRNTTTVNIYRNSQEPFVLVHNLTDDHEYIHKLNDEGQLQEGIYRYKFPWGDTEIGCRLFWRGDRQEDKVFRLYKFSSSGEIRYFEQVWGKEDKSYRTVTEYLFHPDTFSWSKVEIDDQFLA